jgi:signal transduction histidine kinase
MREKAASFIMAEVVRLDDTLKTFLAFAKPATPVFTPTDVVRVLEETLSAIEERYRTEGYRFVRNFPATVPLITADQGQIRQIFLNIFLNSFKAMPQGGTITIGAGESVAPEQDPADRQMLAAPDPTAGENLWLHVHITDEGCGIAPEHLDKIMELFVSFRDDGIGLGLSIVAQLMRLHRGHIRIASSESLGTTFHLYFPCLSED